MTKKSLPHEGCNTSPCSFCNAHIYGARADLCKPSPFWCFPSFERFSVPPAWSLSIGPWELHGRFASAQALSLISEAPVESSPAAHLHVNWPNPNSNPLQPECFLRALIWQQNNRLFLSSFTFSFDSSLILLLTRSAKWIPKKRQACCLVLEWKDAVGIEKCSFCPSF